jgi:hypothetical protein
VMIVHEIALEEEVDGSACLTVRQNASHSFNMSLGNPLSR